MKTLGYRPLQVLLLASMILFLPLAKGFGNPGRDKEKPRLVIRLVIEQMRYEMLLRYWDHFGEEGFKKLAREGVLCRNARINYSNADQSAGFATISTGSYPSMHGIISDQWYDRLASGRRGAIASEQHHGLDGKDDRGHFAPSNLMTSTTGDELKLLDARSKVFSLGMHPISAILGAGKLTDGAFWMDDQSADWMSNSYYMDSLPGWVDRFNDKELEEIYMNRSWEMMMPEDNYTGSTRDDSEAEEGFLLLYRKTFPYNLKLLKRKSNSFRYLKYTPFGNTYTRDFALSLITHEALGQDSHTDLLSISFSANAFVNELFGPRSMEMEDLFVRLDREIAHLLEFLEDRLGRDQVLLVMTSDRGAADPYEYRKDKGLSAQEFKPREGLALLRSYLNVVYEPDDWITGYSNRQIYLNHGLIDQKGYEIGEFQEKVARFMVKKSGVAYALKSSTLQNSSYSEGMMKMVQNSFHPARSGDVFLVLEPGIVEVPSRSGSIYSYDTHIPMIWWGNGFPAGTIHDEVNLRDLAPTISYILNIPYPDASFGKPIVPLIEQDRR